MELLYVMYQHYCRGGSFCRWEVLIISTIHLEHEVPGWLFSFYQVRPTHVFLSQCFWRAQENETESSRLQQRIHQSAQCCLLCAGDRGEVVVLVTEDVFAFPWNYTRHGSQPLWKPPPAKNVFFFFCCCRWTCDVTTYVQSMMWDAQWTHDGETPRTDAYLSSAQQQTECWNISELNSTLEFSESWTRQWYLYIDKVISRKTLLFASGVETNLLKQRFQGL